MTNKEAIKRLKEAYYNSDYMREPIQMAIEALKNERPKGVWEEIEILPEVYDIEGVKTWASKMMCSKCGFTTIAIEGKFTQYNGCPSCFADMREADNDKRKKRKRL